MNDVETFDSVNVIVEHLFNGTTPSELYGIDGDKIEQIEQKYPHVAKQY